MSILIKKSWTDSNSDVTDANMRQNPECTQQVYAIESVQEFLIKLDMKPYVHLVEISTFSLNLVIVRPTIIMNRANKNWAQF